ncbi:MAG: DUF924 domain-containing protein [Sneathiella sp.]|nr:DUF924 domain-containing protein [Sneathiella sp.]
MKQIRDILDFWFLPTSHPDHGEDRKEWWQKNDDFDNEIKINFLKTFEAAENGELLHWCDTAEGSLALVILLDQFPRNMFRDTPRAFASDGKAREIARHIQKSGYFESYGAKHKCFAALPFEHSENLKDQHQSISLFEKIGDENALDFAHRHLVIIEKFGRFPHRNDILGRKSSEAEIEFLQQPNSSF